ncbi:MAG: hypothetical protein RLZZ356_2090, partial [Verrucomicrobiota bacterium]
IGRGSDGAGHGGPAQFAFTTGFLDEGSLTFDGGRAVQHAFGVTPEDGFLLLIQTGQQFTIVLQFHPQRFDQIRYGLGWIHGRDVAAAEAASGVETIA